MSRIEQIIQFLKGLPDQWVERLDKYLLFHLPALWAHGYARIFNCLLKEALPIYLLLLLLAILCILGKAIGLGFIILFVAIPILGFRWLSKLLEKKDKEIYGRVTQLGHDNIYYSDKEERIHRWTNFGLVMLTQFHPFLILWIILASFYSLFHQTEPVGPHKNESPPAIVLIDHRNSELDSAITGFVQNEYHYYIYEEGLLSSQAFQLVYDSLKSLNLRITDSIRLQAVLTHTSITDTAFLHHYRHFFDTKAGSSISLDSIWQSRHYLPRHSWQQLSSKMGDSFSTNKLLTDILYVAFILILFFYRYLISISLRDFYFIDLILLNIRIPKTYLSNIIRKTIKWFFLILFFAIAIIFLFYLLPSNTFLQYLSGIFSYAYHSTNGKLPDILLGFLFILTICTFINYFVFFPMVRRQIMAERCRPAEMPYYEIKPFKNSMKVWFENLSNFKVKYTYPATVQQKFYRWTSQLLTYNPELWRRDAIRFTYEIWLFMGGGLLILILLFGMVQVCIKANSISENWIYDYLAIAKVLLWMFPVVLGLVLYMIKLVHNPSFCLLPNKHYWSFSFKFEKWVGAWLSLIIVSLFLFRKLGLHIFLILINSTSSHTVSLGEMNANLGIVNMNKLGNPSVLPYRGLQSVIEGEYFYLTSEKMDSLSAVKVIQDSILDRLDKRFWTPADRIPHLVGGHNMDSIGIQERYLEELNLPEEYSLHGFLKLREARKSKAFIVKTLNENEIQAGAENIKIGDVIHFILLMLLATILYFEEVIQKEIPLKIWKNLKKHWKGLAVFGFPFVVMPLIGLLFEKLHMFKQDNLMLQLLFYPVNQLGYLLNWAFSIISFPVSLILCLAYFMYLLPPIKRVIYQDFYEPE